MLSRFDAVSRFVQSVLRPANATSRRRQKPRREALRFEQLDARTLMAADLDAVWEDEPLDDEVENLTPRPALLVQFKDAFGAGKAEAGKAPAAEEGCRELLPGMCRFEFPDTTALDAALARYQLDPRVEFLEQDVRLAGAAKPNDPLFAQQWAHHNAGRGARRADADIDSTEAWNVTKSAARTVVAIVDSGIDWKHPDLKQNIWINNREIPGNGIDDDGNGYIDDVRGWDFVQGDNNPADKNGHGTHVAGIVGARGDNGIGVAGVAWKVELMPVRFLDKHGSGWVSDAIAALRYAVDNGASISNHSWGGGGYSHAFAKTIEYARERGHLLVVAAGNEAQSLDQQFAFPAAYNRWYDNVITVAATNAKDQLAGFSNYGLNTVDIAAPGASILSTVPRHMGPSSHKGYDSYSGTSMATPFVTGAVALVRNLNPKWSYRQVVDHVLGTADHLNSLTKVVEAGRRLNVGRAVTRAAAAAGATNVTSYPLDARDLLAPTATRYAGLPTPLSAKGDGRARIAMTDGQPDEAPVCGPEVDAAAQTNVQATNLSAVPTKVKYKITVTGKVNGKDFSLKGYLEVKPTINSISLNDINPRDLFLRIGDPLAKPKTGAIWLATNNAFFERYGFLKAPEKMDLADVDLNERKGTLRMRVDSDLVASGLNRFNASSGLLASMYQIHQGGLDLRFTKNGQAVKGSISLKGATTYLPGVPGWKTPSIQYTATITGKRIG